MKWFLLYPEVHFTVSELVDVLAPGTSNPRSRLNRTLHHLRDYLEPDRGGRSSTFVQSTPTGYRFEPDGMWEVDYWEAKTFVCSASRATRLGDFEVAIRHLEQLTQLDSKVFLPEEIYDDAFGEIRSRQESACQEARTALLELYLSAERLPQALAEGLVMLERDPYNEAAATAVALAHAKGGDRIAAIQSLMEFRTGLQDELQIEPSEDLEKLEQRLRSGEPISWTGQLGSPYG